MGWRRKRIQPRRDGRGESILTDPEMCVQVLVESILVPEYESRVSLDYILEDLNPRVWTPNLLQGAVGTIEGD